MKFKSHLDELLKAKCMSKKELATKLGCHPKTVYNFANSVYMLGATKLINTAAILDVKIDDLFEIIEEKRRTGYERVEAGRSYYADFKDGSIGLWEEGLDAVDEGCYASANYTNDEKLAEDNERADKLMRRLRRYAVEHRKHPIDWGNIDEKKWCITYDTNKKKIVPHCMFVRRLWGPVFDSLEATEMAIEIFGVDILWYFTEYKDSVEW